MNTKLSLDKIKTAMKDKEYRDAIVEEHVKTGLPFQVYGLRRKEGWTQKELGDRASMVQERISLLEKPDYAKFTISTLLKLASAFDVGLTVRFVSFGKVFQEEMNLSDSLIPCNFKEDPMFHAPIGEQGQDDIIDYSHLFHETQNAGRQKNTNDLERWLAPGTHASTEALAGETPGRLKPMPSAYKVSVGQKLEAVGSL